MQGAGERHRREQRGQPDPEERETPGKEAARTGQRQGEAGGEKGRDGRRETEKSQ